VVPDESENFSSGLKPSSSDVIPMIQMGKSVNESKRLSNIDSGTKVSEFLDLERHHFEEDMQRL